MLNEELIYLDMPYSTQNELFEEMSKKFLELGYVNEEYLDALKKREEGFPQESKHRWQDLQFHMLIVSISRRLELR